MDAVSTMHSHGIVHRDIKLDNILVDQNYNPLLCDLEMAGNSGEPVHGAGTKPYMAKELFEVQVDLSAFVANI